MNRTPLIQVVTLGGLPTIRARSSFHWPCFQKLGHSAGLTGSGNGSASSRDFGHLVQKGEVAVMDAADEPLAIHAGQVAAGVIVDHVLIGLPLLVAAQEQPAVGHEVVVHLDDDLEVAIGLVGEDDAAVVGNILAADERAVFDHPAAAGLVAAGTAVARLGADVPAVEVLAVEDRDEAGVVELLAFEVFGLSERGEGTPAIRAVK